MPLKNLTLEITRKCPMRCILCSSDGGEPLPNEFKVSELKNIVNQAKSIGVNEICLSGGEPLTYPNILDICEYISDLGIDVSLYTCGNIFDNNNSLSPIPENYFLKLKAVGIKKVVFSIHGPNSQIHDKITGRQESFKNLINSIKNIKSIDLNIEAHFVPLRENFKELPNIVSFLSKIGLKSIHILRFVPQGRGELYKDLLELRPKEVLELRKILDRMIINKSEVRTVVGAHYNCLGLNNYTQCTAGVEKAIIRPDGFVFPCVGMKRIKSFINCNNIKDERLEDIINESYGFTLLKTILSKSEFNSCQSCISENNCAGCIAQRIIKYGEYDMRKDPSCINNLSLINELFIKNKVIGHRIYPKGGIIDD